MKIKLVQSDIICGVRECPYQCPVSIAARRLFKKMNVFVGYRILRVSDKEIYELPFFVTQWIKEFDRGLKVSPVEFEI